MPPLIWTMFAGPLSWFRQSVLDQSTITTALATQVRKPLAAAIHFKPEDWSQSDQRFGWTLPNRQPLWLSCPTGGPAA